MPPTEVVDRATWDALGRLQAQPGEPAAGINVRTPEFEDADVPASGARTPRRVAGYQFSRIEGVDAIVEYLTGRTQHGRTAPLPRLPPGASATSSPQRWSCSTTNTAGLHDQEQSITHHAEALRGKAQRGARVWHLPARTQVMRSWADERPWI